MSDSPYTEGVTYIWPCEHGGVLVEKDIRPFTTCAECGKHPEPFVRFSDAERMRKQIVADHRIKASIADNSCVCEYCSYNPERGE